MKTSSTFMLTILSLAFALSACSPADQPATADSPEQAPQVEPQATPSTRTSALELQAMEWRNIGPFNGGRGTTVVGHPTDKMVRLRTPEPLGSSWALASSTMPP
jgi:hypothetical protein